MYMYKDKVSTCVDKKNETAHVPASQFALGQLALD
jgi:hypothetical protein